MPIKTVFIAGTMQGSRRGEQQINQDYRQIIARIVRTVYPDSDIRCPGRLMHEKLSDQEAEIRHAHAALVEANSASVNAADHPAPLVQLTDVFHELVEVARDSDLCIAYLPHHEASMGTAVEMYAAYRQGKRVIAVTEMTQNLCVLACSHHIVADFAALETMLRTLQMTSCSHNPPHDVAPNFTPTPSSLSSHGQQEAFSS